MRPRRRGSFPFGALIDPDPPPLDPDDSGLVVRSRRAQTRPCALDPTPLAEVSSWAEQYRLVWEARLDRLEHHLQRLGPHSRGGEADG